MSITMLLGHKFLAYKMKKSQLLFIFVVEFRK